MTMSIEENNEMPNLLGNNKSGVDVMLDFLKSENIVIKSQVTMNQIRSLLKIKWLAVIKKPENKNKDIMEVFQEEIVPYYLALKCSYKRQSRKEILDTLKEINPKFMEESKGLSSMFGGGKDE